MINKYFSLKPMIAIALVLLIELFDSVKGCGVPAIKPTVVRSDVGKIINGKDSVANSWPWMVSLRIRSSSNILSRHFCGGTILDQNTVLTAAHCITVSPSRIVVIVGLHDLSELSSENIYSIQVIYVHPSFNSILLENDVAVIKLARPITFTDTVSPVCLPETNDISVVYNKDVVVTGWGSTTGSQGSPPLVLQQANLRVVTNNQKCFASGNFNSFQQYCVIESGLFPDSNACYGDSGGPMVYFDGTKWTIFGITSYILADSMRKCDPSLPSFYTSVPFYLSYIKDPYNPYNQATSIYVLISKSTLVWFNTLIFYVLIF